MVLTFNDYRKSRDELFSKITETVSNDERFVAGWLTGSFSRNEQDAISDIDITLVVADGHSTQLCQRLEQVSAQTSPDRYALFSQFGTPALIHENNNNAPEGGTFTFVLYSKSSIMVDWVLILQSNAARPPSAKLLFDKASIPIAPSQALENLEQSQKYVAEQYAFFWMMTAITIKYIIREDGVFAAQWIENLHSMIHELERHIDGKSWKYHRGSFSQLQPTREKQIESIHMLCNRMMELKPQIREFTGADLATPTAEIETLLSFASNRQS